MSEADHLTLQPDPTQGHPDMSFCKACGQPREQDAAFCSHCGQKNLEPAKVNTQEQKPEKTPPTPLQELIEAANSVREMPQDEPKRKGQHKCSCGQLLPKEAQYCFLCGCRVGQKVSRYRLVHRSNGAGQAVAIADQEISIGKAPDCDLVIANDDYVSRHHARICEADGMLFLEDLNSSNGTFLRPRRPVALEPGDEILIGTTVFRLEELSS